MTSYLQIYITLFSVLNPLVAIPLYLDTTRRFSTPEKTLILTAFGFAMFSVMAIAFVLGQPLLNGIGIHDYSLKIGGGLIVLLIAISIVTSGSGTDKQFDGDKSAHDFRKRIIGYGVSPLAIPIVIGPGSIIMVILYSQEAHSLALQLQFFSIFLLLSLTISLLFALSGLIYKVIGDIGLVILSKLMGLVLAAVAVEMIFSGLTRALPLLWVGVKPA